MCLYWGLNRALKTPFGSLFGGAGSSGGSGGGGDTEGGGQGEEKEKGTITIEAPSFFSAIPILNSNISKELNFMHLEAIVISEGMASSGKIGELITPYARFREIRRTTKIIICKGTAEKFIKQVAPYSGELVTQTIEELIKNSKKSSFFPVSNLNDAYDGTKSTYHAFFGTYAAINEGEKLPEEGSVYEGGYRIPGDYYAGDVPRSNGQKFEFFGTAVFDGDKMVGKLTGFETQMMMLVRGDVKRMSFTIADPQKPELVLPISIKEVDKLKVQVDIDGDKPKIKLELGMEGDIAIIQSRINYEKPEMKKIVEAAFEKYIEDGINRTFQKCREMKCDVFNFGHSAVKKFLTIPEWEEYNWIDKFPNSEFEVKANFTVRRTGKMLKSMPVLSTEGKE